MVESGDFERVYRFSAVTRGVNAADLSFQIGGRAIRKQVQVGSEVRAGDVLLELDNPEAQPAAAAAENQFKAAQANQRLARSDYDRFTQLLTENAVTQREFDQVKTRLDAANAEAQAARQNLNAFASRSDELRLKAPFDGVVTALNVDVGDVIGPGQVVASMVDPSNVELHISVSPDALDAIQVGTQVMITSSLRAQTRVATGRVREKSPFSRASALPQVIIEVDDSQFGPGEAVDVEIRLQESSALRVPINAVVRISDTAAAVFVVDEGRAQFRTVRPLTLLDDQVVVSGDLSRDEQVVTEGVAKLFDQVSVEVL